MLLSALLLALPVPAPAAPGDLDPSFDGDGRVLTDFGAFEGAGPVVMQPDSKLVAAGATGGANVSNSVDFILVRYNPNGSLDTSFGDGGRVVTDFGGIETAQALVLQPDGKLVAAGSRNIIGTFDLALTLARYNADGTLDTSFGVGGVVVVTEECCTSSLVLQPDGKLVTTSTGGLVRFNPDGTLDTSFGVDGFAFDIAFLQLLDLALQPDGKIVAAGASTFPTSGALERFNRDGSLDTSFGVDGVVRSDSNDIASALALQPDGKLVVAGSRFSTGNGNVRTDITLERFNPDGSLDTSFGTGGLVVIDFGQDSEANALELQADGKLVVAGTLGAIGARDFALTRYHSDGSLDTSFGTGGVVRTDFGGRFDSAAALVLQTDRKLVAAGFSNASGDTDFALARYVTTDEPLAVPPKCGGRRATILGTSGKDNLRGTRGPDVILGMGGNDTIRGLDGNDMICGGAGRDRLIGGDGNDRLFGGGQKDKLFGDKGKDRLDGGSGRDACRTGETARRCEGKPASSKPPPGERPKDPPRPPCPPISTFPCS